MNDYIFLAPKALDCLELRYKVCTDFYFVVVDNFAKKPIHRIIIFQYLCSYDKEYEKLMKHLYNIGWP